jgi:predicted SnoaL-like aldol condensation-catalyzing enzyme
MSDILSWKKWSIYLMLIMAAGSMISLCSPSPRTGVESMAQKHVSKSEDNKSMVIYFFDEVVDQGNQDAVKVLLAPNCKYYDAGKVKTTNVQEFIDYLVKARMPYDSIKVKIDNIIAEGNWVAVRYSYHSVLAGKHSVVPAMAEFLIEDGKIVEMWRYIPARSK